jgi:hypothetical protein
MEGVGWKLFFILMILLFGLLCWPRMAHGMYSNGSTLMVVLCPTLLGAM